MLDEPKNLIPVISAPPKFTDRDAMDQTSRVYDEGSTAVLKCEAKGNPTPVIKWYFNSRPYTNPNNLPLTHKLNPFDYVLKLKTLAAHHVGAYTCNVSNSRGWLTYTYKIDVNGM